MARQTALTIYQPAIRNLHMLGKRLELAALPVVERVWMETLERRVLLSGGELNMNFGAGGVAQAFTAASWSSLSTLAVQQDGKIVAAGVVDPTDDSNDEIAIARFNADGSLDTSFGNNGIVETPVGSDNAEINTLLIQNDGKILVGGTDADQGEFLLARYNADGSLDSSFGSDGIVITAPPASADNATVYGLAESGSQIIAVGQDDAQMAVLRYNADGSPDTTFGLGGLITIQGNANDNTEYALAASVNSDGSIIVVGDGQGYTTTSVPGIGTPYINPVTGIAGALDGWATTYTQSDFVAQVSADGQTVEVQSYARPYGSLPGSVAAQADGKLVSLDQYLGRYNADGTQDLTLGSDGTLGALAQVDSGIAVGARSDGAIFVLGSSYSLERYNPDGSIDTQFANGGLATPVTDNADPSSPLASLSSAVALGFAADGSIYAGGDSFDLIKFQPGSGLTPPAPIIPSPLQPPPVVYTPIVVAPVCVLMPGGPITTTPIGIFNGGAGWTLSAGGAPTSVSALASSPAGGIFASAGFGSIFASLDLASPWQSSDTLGGGYAGSTPDTANNWIFSSSDPLADFAHASNKKPDDWMDSDVAN